MACKDLTKVIDEKSIYVRQWDAQTALENLADATQVFGASLAGFIEGNFTLIDILAAMNKSDTKRMIGLISKFCCAARVDGRMTTPDAFGFAYQSELYFAFKVFSMVCEVNYKDFFAEGERLYNLSQKENSEAE